MILPQFYLPQTNAGAAAVTAAAAVRAALLGDPSIDLCEVAVRDSASAGQVLSAWLVPSGPLHLARLARLQDEMTRLVQFAVELIPVSTIPFTDQGGVDWDALHQVEVVGQAVLAAWEAAVSRLPEVSRSAVVAGSREATEQRWHLADVLPDWKTVLAPAVQTQMRRLDEPAATAKSGPLPLALRAGDARDPAYAVPPTLVDALVQTAQRVAGDRIFFVDASGSRALSYADLLQRAERVLGGLRDHGLLPGDKVILQLVGNDGILEAFWGCVLGGFVPVIAAVPKAYLSSDREFQQLCRVWEAIGRPWLIVPAGQAASALERDLDPARLITLESLRRHQPDHRHHAAQPHDVAFFSLTSGSTGTPKSVMLTHHSVLQRAAGVDQLCGWGSDDVVVNWLPLDHVGSISDWHLRCVATGSTLVYAPKEYVLAKPLRWLDLIDRFRATHSWSPNFAYSLVNRALEKPHDRTWDLSCLTTLLSAGESVSLSIVDRFRELLAPHGLTPTVIRPAFGMAETGSGITYFQPTADIPGRIFNVDRHSLSGGLVMREPGHPDAIPFVSLGPPIPGVTIKIVDANGDTLPEQRIGQLYIAGDAVSAGYFRDDAATRAVFRDDGWFDSGDLAFLSGGELVITGRAKESLIVNGANFYNSEIEAAVEEVPGVSVSFCAACAVRPSPAAAEAVAIFFHTPATDDADVRELIGQIRATLARRLGLKPDFLLPVSREDIPKSPIGKLLRSQLAARFERDEFASVLRRVDVLMANEHTMPNWFFRATWRPKQSPAADGRPAFANTLLLAGGSHAGELAGAAMATTGTAVVRVERADTFSATSPGRYSLPPADVDCYRQLLTRLRGLQAFPDRIVHCWNHGGGDDSAASTEFLALIGALAELKAPGEIIQLDVLTSGARVLATGDAFVAGRAAIAGLVKTIAAEHPWLVCRHVDAPDNESTAALVADELSLPPADKEVALRAGGRFVPRLEQVQIDDLGGSVPFTNGGRYVIHGGLDGVGPEVARYLATRHGAQVLLLGDPRSNQVPVSSVPSGVTVEQYREPAELPQCIAGFELRSGGVLDGIIHVSGLHRERALLDEAADDLGRELAREVDSCRHLCEVARNRPSSLFISFTSAAGFFGGATAGATSAAAAEVTAMTDDLRVHTGQPCYTFAWSLWSHQAESAAGDSSQLARASGFQPVSIRQGLFSLLAGLQCGPDSYVIGLDAQHPRVRSRMATRPMPLLQPVVCFSAPSLVDVDALAGLTVRDHHGSASLARFQQLQEPESVRRAQVELWPSVAEYFVYDDLLYHVLAHDERRNHSYKVAIERSVKDKVVVEIGTGKEAILARFCVDAGARKVYAIEIGDEAFRDATALVAKLGLQDTIELIHGDAAQVELPELADVCVSEIVGPIGGCEGAAVLINDARRFLKPGGIMIPARSVTTIAAATLPAAVLRNPGFNDVPGSYVPKIFDEIGRPFDVRLCVKNVDETRLVSSIATFEDLDFNRPIPLEESHDIELVIDRDARLDGFLVWLNLHTIDGEVINTLQYEYCWLPVFLPVFDPGVEVTAGDRIVASIERRLCENRLNPDFRVRGRLIRASGEQLAFTHDSLHHEGAYRGTPLYDRLFGREPNGLYLDGYRRDLYRRLPEMPVGADGAIDRQLLPVPGRGAAGREADVAPATATEQKIAAIWQDVLEVGQVGLFSNFFELGGHSLLLVQMHERLRDEFTAPFTLVELFKYPTVASLAQFLDGGHAAGSPAAAQGRDQAARRRSRRSMSTADTDVAVIGMSCRFPGADDIDTFWKNLAGGVESITFFSDEEVARSGIDSRSARDPNYVKASSILSDVAGFDPDFFGMSTREAVLMDPQQRVFLECAWEVLEDAGYDPLTYPGPIGVYAGASMNTYLLNQVLPNRGTLDSRDDLGVTTLDSMGGFQLMIGSDKDYLPTQAAYRLNLRGPAVNVQTACSTTLVAIHLAVRSLLDGECDICLAGGASIKVPQAAGHLYQDGMIVSPDGHCRAFDAKAQGTIFGSGVGIVALKRAADAVADGDHIYAVIKGTAVNNDGGTKVGYMSPSGDGQASVAAEALAVAEVAAESITYVEAHGTATELGDPIEIAGLTQAFRGAELRPHSCAVGSVKTNVGHLQIVSGAAGFIKTALALHHAKIPASLHYERPNPAIDFASTPFYVNTSLTDWTVATGTRLAGVNSLGIGGTNAHVILEEAPRRLAATNAVERRAHVLTVSGKTEAALWQQVSRYIDHLDTHPDAVIGDLCFTANAGRHHFDYRIAVTGATTSDLRAALAEQRRQQQAGRAPVPAVAGARPRVVFLFTGQGAQYAGMCRELFETQPTFRRTLERCQEILRDILEVPLLDLLYAAESAGGASRIDETAHTQPALFAIEYALAELWQSWGIRPDACLGHSVGEYVAACVAGVFSLEDALRLVAERGRLMQQLPNDGAMAMIHAGAGALDQFLAAHPNDLSVAAVNAPANTVISGSRLALDQLLAQLDKAGVTWQRLTTSHAFHSPLVEPMLDAFEARAATVTFSPPRIPVIANRDGLPAGDEITTPGYWRRHAREPVAFMAGITHLERQGHSVFLEVGPHPALLRLARETWTGADARWLQSCRRNHSDWDGLLASVAELYMLGCDVDWHAFDHDYERRRLRLPTYPFQRRQCWMNAPAPQVAAEIPPPPVARTSQATTHPLLGRKIRSAVTLYESELGTDTPAWLGDHRVFDTVVTPAAAMLEMVRAAAIGHFKTSAISIDNSAIHQALVLPPTGRRTVQLVVEPRVGDSAAFRLMALDDATGDDTWQLHFAGEISARTSPPSSAGPVSLDRPADAVSGRAWYQQCQEWGAAFGPAFLSLEWLHRGPGTTSSAIVVPEHLADQPGYGIHPILLDGALQTAVASLPDGGVHLPLSFDRCEIRSSQCRRAICHVRRHERSGSSLGQVDIEMFDDRGALLARITGLTLRPARREAIRPVTAAAGRYRVSWTRDASPPTVAVSDEIRRYLIVSDSEEAAARVVEQLRTRGALSTVGVHAPAFDRPADDRLTLNLDQPEDVRRMLTAVVAAPDRLDGVVYLSLSGGSGDATGAPDAAERDCRRLLNFVQAAAQFDVVNGPSLCVVTCGAQPIGDSPVAVDPARTALWGMATVIALEHSEWRPVLVDVDPRSWRDDLAGVVDDVLLAASPSPGGGEDRVAYRGGQRHVARLMPLPAGSGHDRAVVRGDAAYLITGGLGALGLETAGWLAARGAGTIVLAGRRALPASSEPALETLKQRGARVVVVQLDVTDEAQVAALIARINAEIAPLKGVIHAAGLLEDGILINQQADQFSRVLAPKTRGAWNLHVHTQNLALDFFVLYSSLASVTGSPGQANYAAANAFLDGLAWYRRERNLPALSINWGRWADVGLAAGVEAVGGWHLEGFGALTNDEAFAHLDSLMRSNHAQVSVSPIEVSRLAEVFRRLPLFRSLAPAATDRFEQRTFRDRLNAAPAGRRRAMLESFVRESVAAVLGVETRELTDRRAGFSSLGMDSLSTLDLRNRLQTGLRESLPAALAFHYPSLETLTDFLATGLVRESDATPGTVGSAPERPLVGARSRSELDSLLADRMASLKDTLNRSND